jgi:hypothetical protein
MAIETESARRLWMYSLPGLTGDILLQEAEAMGIRVYTQMNVISSREWEELEQRCIKKCQRKQSHS